MDNTTSDAIEILFREFGNHPEYLEMLAEERINTSRLKALSTDAQKDMDDSTARVSVLIRQWQQEYGLPPRPDGKVHTTAVELFAQWNAEDTVLTPEEVEVEHQH